VGPIHFIKSEESADKPSQLSSMVLKLYSQSFPAGGGALVSFVLTEKKIPFEVVTIGLEAKEHKAPEFRALHPFGQLPVLVRGILNFYLLIG
jgi:glutathione S-transferase